MPYHAQLLTYMTLAKLSPSVKLTWFQIRSEQTTIAGSHQTSVTMSAPCLANIPILSNELWAWRVHNICQPVDVFFFFWHKLKFNCKKESKYNQPGQANATQVESRNNAHLWLSTSRCHYLSSFMSQLHNAISYNEFGAIVGTFNSTDNDDCWIIDWGLSRPISNCKSWRYQFKFQKSEYKCKSYKQSKWWFSFLK